MFAHGWAPCRVGIAGGGTDLPDHCSTRTGLCLSLAIAKYARAVAITRADGQCVAAYGGRLDRAGCATEIANGLVRESALLHGFETNFEVHTLSDVPSRGTGLGASSAIAVALAACFERMGGISNPQISTARSAWMVEIDRLRRPIGRQDHMAAACGGLRLYRFEGQTASIERAFSEDETRWTARHLLLLPLREGHDAREILGSGARPDFGRALGAVDIALRAIESRDAQLLGKALREGHASKMPVPGAMPDPVLVQVLKSVAGVHGVKICGAGGGGHLLIACEPGSEGRIAAATGIRPFAVEPDFLGVRSDAQ